MHTDDEKVYLENFCFRKPSVNDRNERLFQKAIVTVHCWRQNSLLLFTTILFGLGLYPYKTIEP